MKKLITTLLIGGLMLSMSACGNKADTEAANITEAVVEETATEVPTVEPTEAPVPEPTEEPSPEPTEEPIEEFTVEEGMNKVVQLINARNDLILNGNYHVEHHFLYGAETISAGFSHAEHNLVTADGVSLQELTSENGYIRAAVVANYFYDYANNNSGYYNFSDYVKSHTVEEILSIWGGIPSEDASTNISIMFEAPGVLEYLLINIETLDHAEMLIGESCTADPVSGIEVYYQIPLTINGETFGVDAVFDKEGNILNIVTDEEDGWSADNYGDCIDEIGLESSGDNNGSKKSQEESTSTSEPVTNSEVAFNGETILKRGTDARGYNVILSDADYQGFSIDDCYTTASGTYVISAGYACKFFDSDGNGTPGQYILWGIGAGNPTKYTDGIDPPVEGVHYWKIN